MMDQVTKTAAKHKHTPRRSFMRDEDGTILFFAVIMMIVMFMLAGMGVDIMRFESTRTELQQTADRATLAATSLSQALSPVAVVNDYFDKAGLRDNLTSVVVTGGLNFRNVRTEARANTNPIFLRLYSQSATPQIEANALSVAEQRISNVEIMLVLDVSGSMAGTKLSDLKTSAKEFIDTVLGTDSENKISIGIVPYNGQVNMTQSFQNLFTNRVDDHGVTNVNCHDLPASVYSGLGLPTNTALPVTANADTFSSTSTSGSFVSLSSGAPVAGNRWCPDSSANVLRPPTNNPTTLKNAIDGLSAIGATSVNAGMKWGMALLDPGSRSLITSSIAQGTTPSYFGGRPFDYTTEDSMKVIVLMTDGQHFAEERVNAGYRAGNSGIWRSSGDGNYSRFVDRSNTTSDWWVPHRSEWRTAAWNSGAGTSEQTWPQMWERQRLSWVAWQLYARANGNSSSVYTSTMNDFRTKTPTSSMDSQLETVCDRARDSKVIVYGIAFEAPSAGAALIQNCSSTPGHFFNADGLEIQTAFRAIANNISQLRLTQ